MMQRCKSHKSIGFQDEAEVVASNFVGGTYAHGTKVVADRDDVEVNAHDLDVEVVTLVEDDCK